MDGDISKKSKTSSKLVKRKTIKKRGLNVGERVSTHGLESMKKIIRSVSHKVHK